MDKGCFFRRRTTRGHSHARAGAALLVLPTSKVAFCALALGKNCTLRLGGHLPRGVMRRVVVVLPVFTWPRGWNHGMFGGDIQAIGCHHVSYPCRWVLPPCFFVIPRVERDSVEMKTDENSETDCRARSWNSICWLYQNELKNFGSAGACVSRQASKHRL